MKARSQQNMFIQEMKIIPKLKMKLFPQSETPQQISESKI